MIQSLKVIHKNEKIILGEPFIVQSGPKVIIQSQQERFEFYRSDISNIRIVRKRDFYPNIIIFCLLLISIYANILPFKNHSNYVLFATISFITVLLMIVFFLKNYNYKLLINTGKCGFSEIQLPKKNIPNVENFLSNSFKESCIQKHTVRNANFVN